MKAAGGGGNCLKYSLVELLQQPPPYCNYRVEQHQHSANDYGVVGASSRKASEAAKPNQARTVGRSLQQCTYASWPGCSSARGRFRCEWPSTRCTSARQKPLRGVSLIIIRSINKLRSVVCLFTFLLYYLINFGVVTYTLESIHTA